MAREPVAALVGAVEAPTDGREGALVARSAFGIEREVFPVGEMAGPARRLLRKRLRSDLDAVQFLLRKAELLTSEATGGGGPAAEDGRFLADEPPPEGPVEDDGIGPAAKRRKVPPFVEQEAAPGRTTPDERERLAARLALLAAALPGHAVAFLQNQSGGDADLQGDGGDAEIDVRSMKEGALSGLKALLDKFAPASTPKNQERAAVGGSGGASCLSQHQDAADDKIAPPVEHGEDVGGASPVTLREIAEEYAELVDAIGVQLLSPLQRKYIDLAEKDEYVDICGDASPVVFPAKAGEICRSPSSSSSDSDDSSSDSNSESSSDGDTDESMSSPPPAAAALPKGNGTSVQPPEPPAAAAAQIAEQEEFEDHFADPAPITSNPPALAIPPKENGISAPPPEPETEAMHGAETAPISSRPPAPAVLPKENGILAPAPEPVQIAEPAVLQNLTTAPEPTAAAPMTNLIARAQEALERRRQEERECAREKARRELVEVERAALPDERVHPLDMEALGILAFEHVVSTAAWAPVNGGAAPGWPSILQKLGLFLKAAAAGEEEEQWLGVAPDGGNDMEMEEGEIR
ncbi:hypothetical protein ACP4OV_005973 [Aristida adscensionis]